MQTVLSVWAMTNRTVAHSMPLGAVHPTWSRATVPAFLDVRTAVLNDTLEDAFRRRHHGFRPANDNQRLAGVAA